MFQYSNEQLATLVGVPIVTLLTIWTVAIFHKNRKKWNSYDIAIVAILVQSVLRNVTILCYTGLVVAKQNLMTIECCRIVIWFFNSVHTFQASSLTSLSVIALFTVKLYRKQQALQQYLTPTHVIYHLFCLTTLCSCVGVAAILAQEDVDGIFLLENRVFCQFMPFDLDIKFNIFIVVLHIFLATVSFASFALACFNHVKTRSRDFEYLKKSTSDLSDLSMSLTASAVLSNENSKGFYDTYTIHRGQLVSQYEAPGPIHFYHGREGAWNSDVSNISTTVSSTNSKKPCIKQAKEELGSLETGLQTMYPILAVCYLFNHLPLIILCIYPRLVLPWSVAGVALWMGQLQDVLITIGLGLVDSRFCKWVSHVYKCTERQRITEKIPPGVGLDGKFRPFSSQPQSLEVTQGLPERNRVYPEHKFPITNGSLYTSIDGRLPIIHNYRRSKDQRQKIITQPINIHASHLKRPTCENHPNMYLPHICRKPSFYRRPVCDFPKHISRSQDTIDDIPRPNLLNHSKLGITNRLSKSEDSLNDIQKELLQFKENSESFQLHRHHDPCISSDDEYFDVDYDAASQSTYSITTEANCDFEFYQHKQEPIQIAYNHVLPSVKSKLKITRSNSKRSLENFHAYVDVKVQRSNSFMAVEERIGPEVRKNNGKNVVQSESVPDFKKIFISDYI